MKILIFALQFLLFANFSCKSQYYDRIYLNHFTENSVLFDKTVSYLQTQREAISFSTNKAVVFFDSSLLNNPKYLSPLKDTLNEIFALNKFKSISYYSSGDMEFLVNTKKDHFSSTETKMVFLFSANIELPFPYLHWKKNRKIKDNWWYLENVDAQY